MTPIYVKMDAKEQLLISEGVCQQMTIMKYNEEVVPGDEKKQDASVPVVRVQLVRTTRIRLMESLVAEVRLVQTYDQNGVKMEHNEELATTQPMLLESGWHESEMSGVQISGVLVQPSVDGVARALITNCNTLTQQIVEGTDIGTAVAVDLINPQEYKGMSRVNMVTMDDKGSHWKQLLLNQFQEELGDLQEARAQLSELLGKYQHVFSLADGERGETNLASMHIDTGNAIPRKQPVRRVLFMARQEVAGYWQIRVLRSREHGHPV